MNAPWTDWIAVGLAVSFAAAWLGFRIWRNWRKQQESKGKADACGAGCEGCPFSKNCGGKNG